MNPSGKQRYTISEQGFQDSRQASYKEISRLIRQKEAESPYMEKPRETVQIMYAGSYIDNILQLQNHSLTFLPKERNFFQLPEDYLDHQNLWLTTIQLTSAN